MLFAVMFEDARGAGKIRKDHIAQHLSFLEGHSAAIRAAGPLVDDDQAIIGGIWLVESESAADVQALVEKDPFWPTGLRKAVSIREWRQVFADGRRL